MPRPGGPLRAALLQFFVVLASAASPGRQISISGIWTASAGDQTHVSIQNDEEAAEADGVPAPLVNVAVAEQLADQPDAVSLDNTQAGLDVTDVEAPASSLGDSLGNAPTVEVPIGYKLVKTGDHDSTARFGCDIKARSAVFTCDTKDARGKTCACAAVVQLMYDMKADVAPTMNEPQQGVCHKDYTEQVKLAVDNGLATYHQALLEKFTTQGCGLEPPEVQNNASAVYVAAAERGSTVFKATGLPMRESRERRLGGAKILPGYRVFKAKVLNHTAPFADAGNCTISGSYTVFMCNSTDENGKKCACDGGFTQNHFNTEVNNGKTTETEKQEGCLKAYATKSQEFMRSNMDDLLAAAGEKFKMGCSIFKPLVVNQTTTANQSAAAPTAAVAHASTADSPAPIDGDAQEEEPANAEAQTTAVIADSEALATSQ